MMWDYGPGVRVYLAAGSTDMRKQINSLSILAVILDNLVPSASTI